MYQKEIREFLETNYLIDFDSEEIQLETDLFENGMIDSYGYVELVTFLESQYSISLTDEEIISDKLKSFSKIIIFVEEKLGK